MGYASKLKERKRRDIHSTIDRQIFKAMDTLKHAKKRLVIAQYATHC